LSKEINADYIEGGFWTGGKVQVKVDNWIVFFDIYNKNNRIKDINNDVL